MEVIDPPPVSTTDHKTPVFEEFITVAVNVREAPVFSGLEAPEILMLTGAEDVVDPPPPHPESADASARAINQLSLMLFIESPDPNSVYAAEYEYA